MSAFTQAASAWFPLPPWDLPRCHSSGNCWSLASTLHSLFHLLDFLVTTKAKSTPPTLRVWFCLPGNTSEPARSSTGVHIRIVIDLAASQRWWVWLQFLAGTACGTRDEETAHDLGPSKHNRANLDFKNVCRISGLTIGSLVPLFSCQLLLSYSHFCPSFIFSVHERNFLLL